MFHCRQENVEVSAQNQVSCGRLRTPDATWYLCGLLAALQRLGGRWNLSSLWKAVIRLLWHQNEPDRSVGKARNTGLKYAGDFRAVGSFRRCSVEGRKLDWALHRCVWVCMYNVRRICSPTTLSGRIGPGIGKSKYEWWVDFKQQWTGRKLCRFGPATHAIHIGQLLDKPKYTLIDKKRCLMVKPSL